MYISSFTSVRQARKIVQSLVDKILPMVTHVVTVHFDEVLITKRYKICENHNFLFLYDLIIEAKFNILSLQKKKLKCISDPAH